MADPKLVGFREGDRVRVTYTGIVVFIRNDHDGPSYRYSYAKTSSGDRIEIVAERENR